MPRSPSRSRSSGMIPNFQWAFLTAQARGLLKWLALAGSMAVVVGSACALFLWSLDGATRLRFAHPWLLWCLPAGGMAIGALYQRLGRPAEGGNNLIVEQIHQPGAGVPRRMAPLILAATVGTHLFGGSAGREGTAVQMGGSVASGMARALRLKTEDQRLMLMAGIAAGFGAVFGTPIAGTVFALEVLSIGRIQYEAVLPCLIAAVVGDWVCHTWGIEHTAYTVAAGTGFHVEPLLLAKVALAGVIFGLGGLLFSELSHAAGALARRVCPTPWLRPGLGGLLVIALTLAVGTRDYLGLGVWSADPHAITLPALFLPVGVAPAGIAPVGFHPWAWLWKLVFTVVTLSTGYKGGEVTPLFFIGAALGNALSVPLGAPTDLMAALGFIALFAAAANTPLACVLMGVELFGAAHTVYMAVACFTAYAFSGHSGIYLSQRVAVSKSADGDDGLAAGSDLRQLRVAGKRA